MDESVLPADYQAIRKIVAAASEPVPAKDVSVRLGKGTGPGQVESVRDKLKRLADRGWLHRTPAGRFTALPQPPA
ncbi:hypothetical protein ACFCYB_42465 [Streptomyces sp. NPDC056309]|uniref:hypothetical protein n=1 Tax=unclassified Streptomyces TaxID=2593676 RepID=UPI0035DBD58C